LDGSATGPRTDNLGRHLKLTQRRIETLECPAGRRDMMVFDDEQLGLGVRDSAAGGKSFLVQYRHAGEKRERSSEKSTPSPPLESWPQRG
jgi:hypothetical protein